MDMKGFKGFDKDLKCRGFQYEVGKSYEEEEAKICNKGFHFCENPHDVFNYYYPGEGNKFCEIEADNVSEERSEDDSKRVSKKIKIKAEISVFHICKIAVSTFFENFGFTKKIESATTVLPMRATRVLPMRATTVLPMRATAVLPLLKKTV